MSHFRVMVIGKDPEFQLAPFHEYECTGRKDEFVVGQDITQELLSHMNDGDKPAALSDVLEWHGLEDHVYEREEDAISADEEYQYAVVKDGKLVKAVRFTNPNKKWDWWVIGGRWSNAYKLKPGVLPMARSTSGAFRSEPRTGYGDQARKGDIDFAFIEEAASKKGRILYQRYTQALTPELTSAFVALPTWEELREQNQGVGIDGIRGIFHGGVRGEVRNKLKEYGVTDGFFWDSEEAQKMLRMTEDQFADYEGRRSWVPYAVVHERNWIARGEMGWFGMSSPTGDYDEYVNKVRELVLSLPDDAIITNVDCHI